MSRRHLTPSPSHRDPAGNVVTTSLSMSAYCSHVEMTDTQFLYDLTDENASSNHRLY